MIEWVDCGEYTPGIVVNARGAVAQRANRGDTTLEFVVNGGGDPS
jgi:hypothetical protein